MKQTTLLFVVAALVMVACGSKKAKESPRDDAEEFAPSDNPLESLGMMGALLNSRLDQPGPYDEPKASSDYDEEGPHYAVLELGGAVVEVAGFSWFGGSSGIELRTLTERLRKLGSDEQVTGLLLRVGNVAVAMAAAEELREALIDFKGDGARKLVCHTETATNSSYYLMTACDSIGLAPTGDVVISGVAAMPLHLKGLLDNLGVEADFLHVGAFKGAAEPLTRERPSKEMIETLAAIMDRAYATQVAAIAEGRKLAPAAVRKLIDTAMFQGEAALSAGLIDRVAVYEDYRDQSLAGAEWTAVELDEASKPDMTMLMKFVGVMPRDRPSEPHVALVHAVGNIIDGKGSGILGAREEIASRTLAAAFRALARDEAVKAIVLRIDSGGGSALASEIIWHAVAEAKKSKPVVVSMGNVAASGGYYIACGATRVYASANTLTGSIGVVGGKLAIAGAMDKIGIKAYPMGRGKRSMMWSSFGRWSADERTVIQEMMEGVYKAFVTRVAEGRGKSYEEIHAMAQGRVWTGSDALAKGLIDTIGGLDMALAEARKLGGVEADVAIEVYPPEPTLMDIVKSLGQSSMPFAMTDAVQTIARDLGPAEAAVVADLLTQLLMLRDSPVLTSWFFPVVLE